MTDDTSEMNLLHSIWHLDTIALSALHSDTVSISIASIQ